MDQELQTLWALAAAQYPELDAHDYEAVYRTLGSAFGPWRPAAVSAAGGTPEVLLAAGGVVDDVPTARAAVAEGWRRLVSDYRGADRVPVIPERPTAGDVAARAPHGLLVRHGLARLAGTGHGVDVPGDLPLRLSGRIPAAKG